MIWLVTGFGLLISVPIGLVLLMAGLYYYLRWRYLHFLVRIFEERPLFIVPRGQPVPAAEDVTFPTTDGLSLHGCYLHTTAASRRGVILFAIEFGSNRWSCVPYCEGLLAGGYDVFAFEPRGQGDSRGHLGYEPMQWVTNYEVEDARAALRYLKGRPDADPRGIGFFGISKGGNAGLLAAVDDPSVRCFVTDGVFPTHTMTLGYARKWFSIYNSHYLLHGLMPLWYYGLVCNVGLRQIARRHRCSLPKLESAIGRLAPRPLLMVHGGGDTYVKPEIAESLFRRAKEPKDFWLVGGAKHNQALHIAGAEYQRRILEFFDEHLAESTAACGLAGKMLSSAR